MKQKKSIFIKKAIPEDANKLLELNRKYNGEENINEDVSRIEKILEENKNEIVFVAVSDDSLVGFVCVQVYRSFCYSRPALEITDLYVEKEMRRQNAATLLIQEVLKFAVQENVLEINLRVNKNNTTAINFYKSVGLEEANHLVFRKRFF